MFVSESETEDFMTTLRHACKNCCPNADRGYWTQEINTDKEDWPVEWCCTNCFHFEPIVKREAKAGGKAQIAAIARIEEIEGDKADIEEIGFGYVFLIFPHWFQASYKVGPRGKVEKV